MSMDHRIQYASRPGGRPLNCPHRPHPQPIIHRQRRRQKEWVDGTQLQGTEYWKAMGLAVLTTTLLFLVWWYGGK